MRKKVFKVLYLIITIIIIFYLYIPMIRNFEGNTLLYAICIPIMLMLLLMALTVIISLLSHIKDKGESTNYIETEEERYIRIKEQRENENTDGLF